MKFLKRLRGTVSRDSAELNIKGCSVEHQWVEYFNLAERDIDSQWESIIWPFIEQFDFSATLELAPGGGRNSEKLLPLVDRLDLVDLNQYAIDLCRERLATHPRRDRVHYHVNDGRSLSTIESGTVTAVYSWDSMVHMDQQVVGDYLKEFARVLKSGGRTFLHHSNYGARGDRTDFKQNPHWRSNGSAERVRRDAAVAGLAVECQQVLDWGKSDDERGLDCISILVKP